MTIPKTNRQLTIRRLEALAASTPFTPEAEAALTKIEQLKVRMVTVQVAPATERDPGEVAFGYYYLQDGELVMCNADGDPLRDEYRHALAPGQDPEPIARRLVRETHRAGPGRGDFYRQLHYPSGGIV